MLNDYSKKNENINQLQLSTNTPPPTFQFSYHQEDILQQIDQFLTEQCKIITEKTSSYKLT